VDLQYPGGTAEEPPFPVEGGLSVSADVVLIATGRKLNVGDLGLEQLKVESASFIRVDESLRTSLPNVFAVGDVNGLGLMDSMAVAQARIAVGAILGKKGSFSQRSVPDVCIQTHRLFRWLGRRKRRSAPDSRRSLTAKRSSP
jgi:pyruvate/2-oxoglutarate dehydrogenase complex dihydrolipoamide dehydrogenase (E3) component